MAKTILLRDVIKTTVSEAYYCDHAPDNSFVRFSLCKTEQEMAERGYIPEGFCLRPGYRPEFGYGLKFIDENGCGGWVHVPKHIMHHWLKELDLMPPIDVVWEDKVIEEYVWNVR